MIVSREAGYREELAKLTPGLRAFARALVESHTAEAADDVVQTALLAAIGGAQEKHGIRLRISLLSSVLSAHRRALRDATEDRQAGARNKTAQLGSVRTGHREPPWRPRSGEAALLDAMPLEWRETLLLVVSANLTYVQTAECLGTTLNAVIGNLAHAREHLSQEAVTASPIRPEPAKAVPYLRVVK